MDKNQKPDIWLTGISEEYEGIEFFINKDEFIIGRASQCQLTMTEPTVSAEHAKIYKKDNQWFIKDLGSTNGTFLNDERIIDKRIRTGDKIKIQSVEFKFINRFDVERTLAADPPITEPPPKTVPRIEPIQEIESPFSTNKEVKDFKPDAIGNDELPGAKAGIFRGLLLALAFTLTINIAIPFLLTVIQTPRLTSQNLWVLFSTFVLGLPILHLPTHWIQAFNWNISTLIVMICIPLGVMGGGFILFRTIRTNRLKVVLSFSCFYITVAFLLQIIFLKLNFKLWLNLFNSTGFGISNLLLQFFLTAGLFFLMVFLFSYLGSFFAKTESS